MTDDFLSLKRNSKNSLTEYAEQSKKINSAGFEKDTRFWSPTPDKAGNARAIIRFLPPSKGEHTPFVKLFTHGFQEGSSWYIENCPTTLDGKECPVCEGNKELWDAAERDQPGYDKHPKKEIVRKRKRKLNYISNVFIVKDDGNSENNGKVFVFRYGKQIFDKINLAMHPQYEDEKAINPFDFWEGANFTLKQKIKDKYPNFEDSAFNPETKPLLASDEAIKGVWESQVLLSEFISPNNFKAYDDLKKRYLSVVKKGTASVEDKAAKKADEETTSWEEPASETKKPAATSSKSADDFFDDLLNE